MGHVYAGITLAIGSATKTAGGGTTTYTWDVGVSLPEVLQDGTYTYVYGHGLVSQTDGSGTQTYVLADGLGSTRKLTDGSGNVTASYAYDAFGAVRSSSGSGSTDYQFTGEFADGTTSLTYLRARWYDPTTGRFLSKDPFSGFAELPQTLHPYVYAANNPVNFTDPSGQCIVDACVIEIATAPIWGPILWAGAVTLGASAIAVAVDARDEIGDRLSALWNGCARAWDDLSTFWKKNRELPVEDPGPPIGKLYKLPDPWIEAFGGEEETSKMKGKTGRSKAKLYWDPDTRKVYSYPQRGKGVPEEVGEVPEEWIR